MSDPGAPDRRGNVFQFSPVVELGHLIQVGVGLVAMSGWALFGYLTIDQRLNAEAAQRALLAQRIDQGERAIADTREQQKTSNSETSRKLDGITTQLGDLMRTLLVPGAHR